MYLCRSGDNGCVLSALSASDGANRSYSSANSTPRLKRKRLRSATPSEGGGQSNGDEYLRSPARKAQEAGGGPDGVLEAQGGRHRRRAH